MPLAHDQVTDRVCLVSLARTTCPACGGRKRAWNTLCGPDYYKLPKPMRYALYQRIGRGYKEAVLEALRYLGVEDFKSPE